MLKGGLISRVDGEDVGHLWKEKLLLEGDSNDFYSIIYVKWILIEQWLLYMADTVPGMGKL